MPINLKNLNEVNQILELYPKSKLLIVTKNRSSEIIQELIKIGYCSFGENRVQEAQVKFKNIQSNHLNLELIGPLQTNKVPLALKIFDTIQSIDRIKLVDEINKYISHKPQKTKNFYIQVNIGEETQKSGVSINNLNELYDYCIKKGINVIGLMCIPPNVDDPSFFFLKLKKLRDQLNPNLKLSMGMSSDYVAALKVGSDLIRIGSKIFE